MKRGIILGAMMLLIAFGSYAQPEDRYTVDGDVVYVERFYEDGTLREKGSFINDVPAGEWVQYYRDGSIHIEAYFKEGKKEGKWFVWSDDGEYLYELMYTDNRMKNYHQWKIEQRNMLVSE